MSDIKFDSKNYRIHTDKNKRIIRKSLEDCGAGRSVLVDKDNFLIAGNGVYEQAQELGIPVRVIETDGKELVVVKRTDLSSDDEKRKLLALADNQASDTSMFDMELVVEDFDFDVLQEFGFDTPEYKNSVLKRNAWGSGGDESRCDMSDNIKLHKKGDFYFTSIWQRSEEGRPLSDIKSDINMVNYFAKTMTSFIPALLGYNLSPDYCIITTPKRRNKETNFATEVCKIISKDLHVNFYEDALLCSSKKRVNAVFRLIHEIPEKNIIIFDDIITTGSTLIAANNALRSKKNCVFLVGINNNK